MIIPKDFTDALALNLSIIKRQTEGLTHADSVLQPPMRGNCLNWVVGHIADNRNGMLKELGLPLILTEAQGKRYGYGSEPVCGDGNDILKLEELLALLEQSQKALEGAMACITPEELARPVKSYLGVTTLGKRLYMAHWHESYHTGQTEYLRQLSGTNDKVI